MTYSDSKTAFDKALAAYKRAAQREVAAVLEKENVTFYISNSGGYLHMCWDHKNRPVDCPRNVQKIFDAFSTRTGRFLFSDKELENLRVKMERDSFWKAGICPITGKRLKKKGSD